MSTQSFYVINGFFMAMREKYTTDGAKIAYLTVEWPESKCSWADFRAKVLGATDPNEAAAGSMRKQILEKWKELGLSSQPNVGDNGVHASASPFEALAERMNWLGVSLEEDLFGKALLEAGIPKETLMEWSKDPQVDFEGGKKSLFDLLEDLNCTECIKKACAIAGVKGSSGCNTNAAFVFVKPHAANDAVKDMVKKGFAAKGFEVQKEGELDGKTIGAKNLVDNHYYSIASKATLMQPRQLNVSEDKQEEFKKLFGVAWPAALRSRQVLNARDACKRMKVTGDEMDTLWAKAKKEKKLVKFGGGFYCGLVEHTQPLKKATFQKVSAIKPDSQGLNLTLKVVSHEVKLERENTKIIEAVCGDETGVVTVSLKNDQCEFAKDGAYLVLRNAHVNMFRAPAAAGEKTRSNNAHIRVEVSMWGKIERSTDATFDVKAENDISARAFKPSR